MDVLLAVLMFRSADVVLRSIVVAAMGLVLALHSRGDGDDDGAAMETARWTVLRWLTVEERRCRLGWSWWLKLGLGFHV